ncbi:hypothetical protein BD311DRAFT_545783 [Dichomitus squalens]|uniref:Uncharacterized protein n=1 Tax=Dichomitus squalens TaxID=114155 RepID=A0A4Q9N1L5_9APHY|nr:hypothetical protein BD311DRAFT_545783 [Dichomitus squalens]
MCGERSARNSDWVLRWARNDESRTRNGRTVVDGRSGGGVSEWDAQRAPGDGRWDLGWEEWAMDVCVSDQGGGEDGCEWNGAGSWWRIEKVRVLTYVECDVCARPSPRPTTPDCGGDCVVGGEAEWVRARVRREGTRPEGTVQLRRERKGGRGKWWGL